MPPLPPRCPQPPAQVAELLQEGQLRLLPRCQPQQAHRPRLPQAGRSARRLPVRGAQGLPDRQERRGRPQQRDHDAGMARPFTLAEIKVLSNYLASLPGDLQDRAAVAIPLIRRRRRRLGIRATRSRCEFSGFLVFERQMAMRGSMGALGSSVGEPWPISIASIRITPRHGPMLKKITVERVPPGHAPARTVRHVAGPPVLEDEVRASKTQADLAKLKSSGVKLTAGSTRARAWTWLPPSPAEAACSKAAAAGRIAAARRTRQPIGARNHLAGRRGQACGRTRAAVAPGRALAVERGPHGQRGRCCRSACRWSTEIASSVWRNPGALVSLARLKNHDDYSYMHSVAVCALMVTLARQLGQTEAASARCRHGRVAARHGQGQDAAGGAQQARQAHRMPNSTS